MCTCVLVYLCVCLQHQLQGLRFTWSKAIFICSWIRVHIQLYLNRAASLRTNVCLGSPFTTLTQGGMVTLTPNPCHTLYHQPVLSNQSEWSPKWVSMVPTVLLLFKLGWILGELHHWAPTLFFLVVLEIESRAFALNYILGLFFFWDRVLLRCQGQAQTFDPPASATIVLDIWHVTPCLDIPSPFYFYVERVSLSCSGWARTCDFLSVWLSAEITGACHYAFLQWIRLPTSARVTEVARYCFSSSFINIPL